MLFNYTFSFWLKSAYWVFAISLLNIIAPFFLFILVLWILYYNIFQKFDEVLMGAWEFYCCIIIFVMPKILTSELIIGNIFQKNILLRGEICLWKNQRSLMWVKPFYIWRQNNAIENFIFEELSFKFRRWIQLLIRCTAFSNPFLTLWC